MFYICYSFWMDFAGFSVAVFRQQSVTTMNVVSRTTASDIANTHQ